MSQRTWFWAQPPGRMSRQKKRCRPGALGERPLRPRERPPAACIDAGTASRVGSHSRLSWRARWRRQPPAAAQQRRPQAPRRTQAEPRRDAQGHRGVQRAAGDGADGVDAAGDAGADRQAEHLLRRRRRGYSHTEHHEAEEEGKNQLGDGDLSKAEAFAGPQLEGRAVVDASGTAGRGATLVSGPDRSSFQLSNSASPREYVFCVFVLARSPGRRHGRITNAKSTSSVNMCRTSGCSPKPDTGACCVPAFVSFRPLSLRFGKWRRRHPSSRLLGGYAPMLNPYLPKFAKLGRIRAKTGRLRIPTWQNVGQAWDVGANLRNAGKV